MLESVYEKCFCHELRIRGIPHVAEVPLPIVYRGAHLGCELFMDIVVDEQLVIELKTVEMLLPIHEAQLLTYLKPSRIRRGLLINFNVSLLKDGLKRLVFGF